MGFSYPIPIDPDTNLALRVQSSQTTRIVLDVLIKQKGHRTPRAVEFLDVVPGGDRLVDTDERLIPGDELWGFSVRADGILRRGQTYVVVALVPDTGGSTSIGLAKGYVSNESHVFPGVNDATGDGQGDTAPESIGTDIAGNVVTSHDLILVNGIRRVDGLIFYYHSDGNAANRESTIRIRDLGGAVPTGFDAGSDRQILALTGPSLIADQDGVVYMNKFGYTVVVDNNVITTLNNTTAPNPFPFWVSVDDVDSNILFDVAAGLAGDTYGGYVFGETWFV